MEQITILEWNIHSMRMRGIYPDFIVNSIKHSGAKIIILVEYKENTTFEGQLEELGYKVFTNGPIEGHNEILVGLKKDLILKNTTPLVLTELPIKIGEHKLNFLHVNFYNKSNKQISILGIRTRDICGKSKQLNPLHRYLVALENKNRNLAIIVGGDFNARSRYMENMFSREFSVITPEHNKALYGTPEHINNYSCFVTDKKDKSNKIQGKVDIDHFLCNNNVAIENAEYSWSFTNSKNVDVYPKEIMTEVEITDVQWNIPVRYPDHAILTALIKLKNN